MSDILYSSSVMVSHEFVPQSSPPPQKTSFRRRRGTFFFSFIFSFLNPIPSFRSELYKCELNIYLAIEKS